MAASSWLLVHEQQKPWLAGMRAPLGSAAQPHVGFAAVGWSLQAVMVLPPVLIISCAHRVNTSLNTRSLKPGIGTVTLVRALKNAGPSPSCMHWPQGAFCRNLNDAAALASACNHVMPVFSRGVLIRAPDTHPATVPTSVGCASNDCW